MLEPLGIAEDQVMNYANLLIKNGHDFQFCSNKLINEDEIMLRASVADVLLIVNSPLSAKVIKSAKNLKMISVAFTGVDHVDAAACREKGIVVCNAQNYSTITVAELVFGLILSVLRNIIPCDKVIREGKTKDGLVGSELYGKTMGIVGTGAIGRRVAEIAKVFGCKLLGYDTSENLEAKKLGITFVDLERLLKESDVVTLHTPLTDKTEKMMNQDRINMMKPTSILINAARGPIVDSYALARALNEGKIAGAGIDVFEIEPPIPIDHPLISAKNAILTPHIAFAAKESLLRRAEITFNNIMAWINGKPENVKI